MLRFQVYTYVEIKITAFQVVSVLRIIREFSYSRHARPAPRINNVLRYFFYVSIYHKKYLIKLKNYFILWKYLYY